MSHTICFLNGVATSRMLAFSILFLASIAVTEANAACTLTWHKDFNHACGCAYGSWPVAIGQCMQFRQNPDCDQLHGYTDILFKGQNGKYLEFCRYQSDNGSCSGDMSKTVCYQIKMDGQCNSNFKVTCNRVASGDPLIQDEL